MQPRHATALPHSNGKRKEEHLRVAMSEDIQCKVLSTGLENYQFVHQALPEIDLDGVDLSTSVFGKTLKAPIIISSMVGGIEAAGKINRNLARAAQVLGLGMGIGSQRCALDDPATAATYAVREMAPDILLFANVGAIQLNNGYGIDECRRAVDMVKADALILHLNPLQEALQPEGDTNFAGLLGKIERVCRDLEVPVIAKEVGFGISADTAGKLASAGVSGIDIAGAGGTSWSEVERLRSGNDSKRDFAACFASWGISTADSVQMVRSGAPSVKVIASGGIRTGLDAAKCIALGADAAGIAAPLLKAANDSAESVIEALESIIQELSICLFCTGTSSPAELKHSPLLKRKPGS